MRLGPLSNQFWKYDIITVSTEVAYAYVFWGCLTSSNTPEEPGLTKYNHIYSPLFPWANDRPNWAKQSDTQQMPLKTYKNAHYTIINYAWCTINY